MNKDGQLLNFKYKQREKRFGVQLAFNTIHQLKPTCLYEGCNSMRSFGTGHLGLGFSGRANSSGVCISYKYPQPGNVHFSLSKATQSRHRRCLQGVMTGKRHHSSHLPIYIHAKISMLFKLGWNNET